MSLSKEIVIGYTKGLLIDRDIYTQDLKDKIEAGDKKVILNALSYRLNELDNNSQADSVKEVIDQLDNIF